MARRRLKRVRAPGRPLRQDQIWKEVDETRPSPLRHYTNTQAIVPWQQELLAPQQVVKYCGRYQVLPDEYTSLYKARQQQARYKNYIHKTQSLTYGVQRRHLYRDLRARDIIYPKGSALERIY